LIKRFLLDKPENLFAQSFKYALGGGVSFVADFFILFLLTSFFHIHYLASAAIAYVLGSAVHYVLSVLFVFSSRRLENRSIEFILFALIGVIGLGMNEGIMWFFTEKIGFYYLYSKLIATFFVFFWNFSSRKYILFR